MTKFQKIERIIAFVPGFSVLFIGIATYFALWKRKASAREWWKYALFLGGTAIVLFLANTFLLSGKVMISNLLLTMAIGLYPNMEMIKIQSLPSESKAETSANEEDSLPDEKSPERKTSRKKLLLTLGIILLAVIMIVGIIYSAVRLFDAVLGNAGQQIEDTNGEDDLTLCKLTDDDIISAEEKSALLGFSQSVTGDRSDIDRSDTLAEVDGDSMSLQFGKFSGVDTVHATKSKANTLKLSVSSEIVRGNCRIVVLVDGKYYCDVPPNTSEVIALSNVAGKLVTVKLAGESLKINMKVTREMET